MPYGLEAGTAIRARRDRTTVKLYQDRVLVKTHPRQPDGGTCLDAADMPPEKAALALRDGSSLVAAAVSHGAHVGVYAERLLAGPLPWTRMRHLYRLLGLVERHGAAAVNDACGRALALDVVDVVRIDRMLEKGLAGPAGEPCARPPAAPARHRFERAPSEFASSEPAHADA